MNINELPDDCLLAIFDHINFVGDLTDCFKVCDKWSYLIAERTKKVKYFVAFYTREIDSVYYWPARKNIDGRYLRTLFPNLLVAQLTRLHDKINHNDFVEFYKNQKSLKGLLFHVGFVEEYFKELEMICFKFFDLNYAILIRPSVKQLHTPRNIVNHVHDFTNLERLSIKGYPDGLNYNARGSAKLKIFECPHEPLTDFEGIHHGFHFIDLCPNLQSAYIVVNSNSFFVNESFKHQCLRDLVIYFTRLIDRIDWNELKIVLLKYPNLKHLALRRMVIRRNEHVEGIVDIENECIEQLVHMLPNLVLLDVRGCRGVNQTAADYVQHYCERHRRSIKFYFNENRHEIKSDWPHLSTKREKFCRGFDFMKNCFLKYPIELPIFLIPNDY